MTKLCSQLLQFVCLGLGWMIMEAAVAAAPPAQPVTVQTGIQWRELRLTDADPDTFRANFIIWFSWESKPGQSWHPDKVLLSNALGDPAAKVPIWTKLDRQSPNQQFKAMVYEGNFKAYNKYETFPVDTHYLSIRIACPQASCGNVNFVSSPDMISVSRLVPHAISGWKITGTGFATEDFRLPEDLNLATTLKLPSAETKVNSFVIQVRREFLPGLVLIYIPLVLIWFLAYIGLYWEDSSPASRFGATALFSAIAFNLATRSLQPAVQYVTLMNLAFLGLYINIVLIVVITTLSFHFRSRMLNHKQVAHFGRWLSPLLLILTILLLLQVTKIEQAIYSELPPGDMQFKDLRP